MKGFGFQVSKQRSTALRLFSFTASKGFTPHHAKPRVRMRGAGFTFVEIAMVVGILALLSTIVIVNMNIRGNKSNANNIKRRTDLESIQQALDLRAQETGDSLPSGLTGGLAEKCIGMGSDIFNLNNISWTESAGDPDIKMQVGTCNASNCSDVSWGPQFSSSPATLSLSSVPYFQYKATFNPSITPWLQTTDADFNTGTNANTTVSGGGDTAKIELYPNALNAVTTLDLSLGNASGGCSGIGLSWASPVCTINTNSVANGIFEFTSINISSGRTLKVSGTNKLTLRANSNATISGVIDLNGINAANYCPSTPNNGGGGTGGQFWAAGAGVGPGGIGGGATYGCGAGFGGTGGDGNTADASYNGGVLYGASNSSDVFYGGSGGGGGAGGTTCESSFGGGGGSGAGAIRIIAPTITVNSIGIINAKGGSAGGPYTSSTNNGGGGAGGGVLLQAQSITNNGVINVMGGNGGNGGSSTRWKGAGGAGGRIRMETIDGASITAGTIGTNIIYTAGSAGTIGASSVSGAGNGTFSSGVLSAPNNNDVYLYSSGTYTSTIKEVGFGTNFSTVSWTETLNGLLPSNTPVKIKVRSCNDDQCSGEPVFSSITAMACTGGADNGCTIDNGGNLTALSSVANGGGWVQYEITFSNGGDTAKTPSLDSITINYYSFDARPILKDVTIDGTAQLIGDQRIFKHTAYNHFFPGSNINPASSLIITGSANSNNEDAGTIEYSAGSPPVTYASSVFSGYCYDLATDLAPLYVGTIPKDPKTGTDANTGYLISVDPATKVVCVKAPAAENDEVIENCRK